MLDIKFDVATREIVMIDGDFTNEAHPSIQNGGILQFSRVAFLNNPMYGIGMEQVINSDLSKVTFEMNRWKQQAISDGARIAKWKAVIVGNDVSIETEISYE